MNKASPAGRPRTPSGIEEGELVGPPTRKAAPSHHSPADEEAEAERPAGEAAAEAGRPEKRSDPAAAPSSSHTAMVIDSAKAGSRPKGAHRQRADRAGRKAMDEPGEPPTQHDAVGERAHASLSGPSLPPAQGRRSAWLAASLGAAADLRRSWGARPRLCGWRAGFIGVARAA